jgi:hypothetical protein
MNANTTNLLASVISGVLGGSLAGVFVAGRIAERTEAGRRRYQAKANLLCEMATYRHIITVRRKAHEVHPSEYLGPEKIEELTERLAGELPYLRRLERLRLRRLLVELAGSTTVDNAEARAFVERADRVKDQRLEAAAALQAAIRDHYRPNPQDYGLLGALDRERDNEDRLKAVVAVLDRMIPPVSPTRRRWVALPR